MAVKRLFYVECRGTYHDDRVLFRDRQSKVRTFKSYETAKAVAEKDGWLVQSHHLVLCPQCLRSSR